MKTAEELKNKLKAISFNYEDEDGITHVPWIDLKETLDAIDEYASQNTLNREKVMEMKKPSSKQPGQVYENAYNDGWNEALDAICSLAIPSVSEEEIEEKAKNLFDADNLATPILMDVWIRGAKWMKELLTPKEEK